MLENLIFFNHWQNGDIHVSRQLVKFAMSLIPAKNYIYCHNNSSKLLQDIPNLKIEKGCLKFIDNDSRFVINRKDLSVSLNTWYGVSPTFTGLESCTLQTLYDLFKINIKQIFNFEMKNSLNDFVPEIDYSRFDLKNIDNFIKNEKRKKVLVSNGPVISGQAVNFSFDPVVDTISLRNPDYLFLVTNGTQVTRSNVLNTADIIQATDNDLIENSYLSTFCDRIIGRSSGAYTYSLVKKNFLNPDLKFICFCKYEKLARWYDSPLEVNCQTLWYDSVDEGEIIKSIEGNL